MEQDFILRTNANANLDPVRINRRRVTPKEREYIWSQTSGQCYICRVLLPKKSSWHVEHVVAFSADRGKNDVLGNMLPSCAKCNLKKLNRPLMDCISSFASSLDSSAADASHLNTSARDCLLNALKLKHELYHTANTGAAAEVDPSVLDAIEDAIEDAVSDGAKQLLPPEDYEVFRHEKPTRGGFGAVYKGRHTPTGVDVAVKFSRDFGAVGKAELDALGALASRSDHQFIVHFYGLLKYEWSKDKVQYGLVFEYCPWDLDCNDLQIHGDMIALVGQTADALTWLHSKSYIHRDVKPQNILVSLPREGAWDAAQARLADFGAAKQIIRNSDADEVDEHTRNVGTSDFRPPESRTGQYYPQSDVYSLGKTMTALKTNRLSPLFNTNSEQLRMWEKVEGECCEQNYKLRCSAEDVRVKLYARAEPTVVRNPQTSSSAAAVTPAKKKTMKISDAARRAKREVTTAEGSASGQSSAPAATVGAITGAVARVAVTGSSKSKNVAANGNGQSPRSPTGEAVGVAAAGGVPSPPPSVIKSPPKPPAPRASASETVPDDSPASESAEGSTRVYVSDTARITSGSTGRSKLKYHLKQGCYDCTTCTTQTIAEKFGHTVCSKCATR